MNSETSASAARYQSSVKAMQQERFWKYPETQAEAIAKHYVCLAMLALQTLEMIKAREHGPCTGYKERLPIDDAIERNIKTIKDTHAHDFGIELEWRSPTFWTDLFLKP